MSCLDDNAIAAFVGGSLSADDATSVASHLETCANCRQLVAALVRSERSQFYSSERSDTLPSMAGAAAALSRGSRLGRYIVLDTLGAGGMGVVYAAYDPVLERKVAVKVVRAKGTPQAQEAVRARLLREGKTIARLSHPHIVAVFDMSAAEGQVFIAMELAAKGSLKRWLHEEKRGWHEVLDKFLDAARGLEAAHREGLVHRDFKPENVLVGDDGRVRVTDFGLSSSVTPPRLDAASATTRPASRSGPSLTEEGVLMGTPAYMAPEQYMGRTVDAQSDQFSFCVALWEGLYGERPFTTTAEAAKWELKEPPATTLVPLWVKRALLRGLSREPASRFSDMASLIAALSADPDQARRRRWQQAMAAALFISVVSASAYWVSTRGDRLCSGAQAQVDTVWNANVAENVRSAFMQSGLDNAEASWALVRGELDEYWRQWAATYTEACRATRVSGEQSDQLLDLRMACLERRRREARALIEVFKTANADVAIKAAEAVNAMAPLAGCSDSEALLARLRPPETPDMQTQVAVVSSLLEDGKARFDTGQYKEALKIATEGVKVSSALGYRPAQAEALLFLGQLQEHMGDLKASEQNLLDAISAAEAGKHDEVTAQAATHLMLVLGSRQARYGEALAWGKLADGAIRRMGASPALTARLLQTQGLIAYAQGKLSEAIDFHKKAAALLEKLEPGSLALADSLNTLGAALRGGRRAKEALAAYERALAILLKKVGPDSDLVATTRNGMGNAYMLDGRFKESLALYEQALATFEKLLGPTHFRTVTTLNNIGVLFAEQSRFDDALPYFEQVLKARENSLAPTDAKTADAHSNVGMLLLELGRLDEAQKHFEKALGILQGYPLDHFSQAEPLLGIAKRLLAKGQGAKAEAPLQRVAALCQGKEGFRFDATRARADFLMGRALWEGKQKKREGHALVSQARDALEGFGRERFHRDLREVERWLAEHPAP